MRAAEEKKNGEMSVKRTLVYCAGLMAILFIWAIINAGVIPVLSLLQTALLITLGYIAMIYDLNTKRIPNTLVLVMITGWFFLVMPMILISPENGFVLLADSLYGLLAGGGLFLLVYFISRKGLGGGDVKFMAAAGLYLGFTDTLPAILYGTVLAALTGLVLILLKKIGRKDTIPLVPFLLAGILIAVFTQ